MIRKNILKTLTISPIDSIFNIKNEYSMLEYFKYFSLVIYRNP